MPAMMIRVALHGLQQRRDFAGVCGRGRHHLPRPPPLCRHAAGGGGAGGGSCGRCGSGGVAGVDGSGHSSGGCCGCGGPRLLQPRNRILRNFSEHKSILRGREREREGERERERERERRRG